MTTADTFDPTRRRGVINARAAVVTRAARRRAVPRAGHAAPRTATSLAAVMIVR